MKRCKAGLSFSEISCSKSTITVLRLLSLISLLLFAAGCTSLPNAPKIIDELPPYLSSPQIKTVNGFLSPRQSKVLLERLKHSTNTSNVLERQTAVIEAVSGSPLIKGNRVELLMDGPPTYNAIFKAVTNAEETINLETFIFQDDDAGKKLADLLIRKHSEGVTVNIIYDAVGSIDTPSAFFQGLKNRGINVVEFNPLNPFNNQVKLPVTARDHRKNIVVDGKLAIIGGVNISQVYTSRFSGIEKGDATNLPWRDTDVLIEGPAVVEFQKIFLHAWHQQKGPELAKKNYFPKLEKMGNEMVQVVNSSPGELGRTTFIMYVSAVTFAEQTVHVTASYFVPDEQMVDALVDAARRGVEVKIVLPEVSDSSMALYASWYYYDELLEAGVKLYKRGNAVLHAKTAVIDGIWSTVGSTNLDSLSFSTNFEVNAVILGTDFAAEMEKMFVEDLANSDEITKEHWDERSLFSRIREWIAHLFAHML